MPPRAPRTKQRWRSSDGTRPGLPKRSPTAGSPSSIGQASRARATAEGCRRGRPARNNAGEARMGRARDCRSARRPLGRRARSGRRRARGRQLKEAAEGAPHETTLAKLGWDAPGTAEALADRWVAELDRAGVARAV